MSDRDIQLLRAKIINGISASSTRLLQKKIQNCNAIAVMQNNRVRIVSPRLYAPVVES